MTATVLHQTTFQTLFHSKVTKELKERAPLTNRKAGSL